MTLIFCRKIIKVRFAYALAAAFCLGLISTAIVGAGGAQELDTVFELSGVWLTLMLTYFALAFGFWVFLNLNRTSLRLRMLQEILHAKHSMTRAALLSRYTPEEFLRIRLIRLDQSGDLVIKDGCYSLGSRKLLYIDNFMNAVRALIFAGTVRDRAADR